MSEPSAWVQRFAGLVRPGGTVLDLACGSGRHLRWLAARGHAVTGVDRDAEALAPLAGLGELIVADIEASPWPLAARRFDAVVVTNYLWRPLLPRIAEALADEGVLLYETFAHGQQSIGRPARAEFLLAPGELLSAFAGLRVVAFEDGFEQPPAPGAARFVQRLAAVRLPAAEAGAGVAAKIRRFPLQP
ncbi:MAG: class I SAM-dependent methyltransferase [Rubrivivax sp.]